MNKKDLEKLGLTSEALKKAEIDEGVLDQIIVLHGKDIEAHKARITTVEGERDGLKEQLAEAGATIEDLKKLDPEGVKKRADEWEAKAKAAQKAAEEAAKEAEAKLAAMKFDHTLDAALGEAKAKNPKAVKALLSLDNLKLNDEDGSIVGLSEQLEKIKSENDYLFSEETPTPKIITGGNNSNVIGDSMVTALRKGAGLEDAKEDK
jgi:hypothetical protein